MNVSRAAVCLARVTSSSARRTAFGSACAAPVELLREGHKASFALFRIRGDWFKAYAVSGARLREGSLSGPLPSGSHPARRPRERHDGRGLQGRPDWTRTPGRPPAQRQGGPLAARPLRNCESLRGGSAEAHATRASGMRSPAHRAVAGDPARSLDAPDDGFHGRRQLASGPLESGFGELRLQPAFECSRIRTDRDRADTACSGGDQYMAN